MPGTQYISLFLENAILVSWGCAGGRYSLCVIWLCTSRGLRGMSHKPRAFAGYRTTQDGKPRGLDVHKSLRRTSHMSFADMLHKHRDLCCLQTTQLLLNSICTKWKHNWFSHTLTIFHCKLKHFFWCISVAWEVMIPTACVFSLSVCPVVCVSSHHLQADKIAWASRNRILCTDIVLFSQIVDFDNRAGASNSSRSWSLCGFLCRASFSGKAHSLCSPVY